MNYKAWRERDRELHKAYHAARGTTGTDAARIADEQDQHHEAHRREYTISDRIRVWVAVSMIKCHVNAVVYEGEHPMLYLAELDRMTAEEIRTAAEVRAVAQAYQDGAIEELPPSGTWSAAVAWLGDTIIPVALRCLKCGAAHTDEGEWATRPHRVHQCVSCNATWRPYAITTIGVPST